MTRSAIIARPDRTRGWVGKLATGEVRPSAIVPHLYAGRLADAVTAGTVTLEARPVTYTPHGLAASGAALLYVLEPTALTIHHVRPNGLAALVARIPAGIVPTAAELAELDRLAGAAEEVAA